MNSGIYEIRNLINGHIYIGSSARFNKRWVGHKCDLRKNRHHSPRLQNAWNKYGEGSLSFSPILFCSNENLIVYEQCLIDGLNPEYNFGRVAGSNLGMRHGKRQPWVGQKISASLMGHKVSPETGAKISAANIGRKCSPESRLKMSLSGKGRIFSESHRANIAASKLGKKRKPFSIEARAKMSASQTGRKHSEETKKKISDDNFRRWALIKCSQS